ncbi:MAG: type IV pili methyl-accepting chemotaxis transducer N-terminal domain-containing protein [Paracoccaceae bacterium]
MKFQKVFTFLVATSILATPLAAQQAQVIQAAVNSGNAVQENAEKRIRTSVRIKMRAQSIAASVCHLQLGIDQAALHAPLDGQVAEFEQFVSALTVGDASLDIVEPETRRKTLHAASLITDSWTTFKPAVEKVAAGNGDTADVDVIVAESLHVLEAGHDFTAELVQQYANPAQATFADLFTIVLATRQGMLAQKMSKQACLASYSGGDAAENLGKTMKVFESTLEALRDGMPAAGIGKPPTKEIAAVLEKKVAQWAAVKPLLMEIQNGSQVSVEAQIDKMNKLDELMEAMLEVSSLYVGYTMSKQN